MHVCWHCTVAVLHLDESLFAANAGARPCTRCTVDGLQYLLKCCAEQTAFHSCEAVKGCRVLACQALGRCELGLLCFALPTDSERRAQQKQQKQQTFISVVLDAAAPVMKYLHLFDVCCICLQ